MPWWNPFSWGRRSKLGEIPDSPPRAQQLDGANPRSRQRRRVIGIEGREGHPGRNMTMSALLSAHDNAENGYPSRLFDMFRDRLKADGHMRSHVEHRRDDVVRNLEVLAGGPNDTDKRAADELSRALRLSDGFLDALKAHQMSFWYGFALTEVSWVFRGGLFEPALFDTPDNPRRFVFDANDRPYLPTENNYEGEPLRPGGWWYTKRHGDRPAVAGDGFTACIWSHFKTLSMADWLQLSDRFGVPFVYGSYQAVGDDDDDAASDEDITVLEEAVSKLGRERWAVFSNAAEIKVVEAMKSGGGAGEIHNAIIAACNDEISKLIAGATTLSQTSGTTGSYAQSRVHADRGFNLYQSDAAALTESLECYLGRAWVLYNSARFPGAAPPRFKFHLVQDQSPTTRAQVFDVAVNKLRMPVSEEQIRTELQLKPAIGPVIEPAAMPDPATVTPEGSASNDPQPEAN